MGVTQISASQSKYNLCTTFIWGHRHSVKRRKKNLTKPCCSEYLISRPVMKIQQSNLYATHLAVRWDLLVPNCKSENVSDLDCNKEFNFIIGDEDLQDSKKFVALGNTLLKVLILLSRSQYSNSFRAANVKKVFTEIDQGLGNAYIGEHLTSHKLRLDKFVAHISDKDWLLLNRFGAIHTNEIEMLTMGEELRQELAQNNSSKSCVACQNFGKDFKCFLAICFLKRGMSAVWNVCEDVGFVERVPDLHLSPCIDAWQTKTETVHQEKQPWEEPFTYFGQLYKPGVLTELGNMFGYQFFQIHRSAWGLIHPSWPLSDAYFFWWLVMLGRLYLDCFYQWYAIKYLHEWDQTKFNRDLSGAVRRDICWNVALKLQLPYIGKTSVPHVNESLMRMRASGDLERGKAHKATYTFVTSITVAFVGSLAIDVGFSVETVNRLLYPCFSVELQKHNESPAVKFDLVYRYVPTNIEATLFENETEAPNQYYSTLVKYIRREENEAFFAFYILTKKPISGLDEFIIQGRNRDHFNIVRFEAMEKPIALDEEINDMLVYFQMEYFLPLYPPDKQRIKKTEAKKKYLIAPAQQDSHSEWVIDRALIEFVIKKRCPEDFEKLLLNLNKEDQTLFQDIERINSSFNLSSKSSSEELTSNTEVVMPLLFLTSSNSVLSVLKDGNGLYDEQWTGTVINERCMWDWLMCFNTDQITFAKAITFAVQDIQAGDIRILPYTYSYFKCLCTVPYALDMFERKLLAEDYRDIANFPISLSNSELLRGLTSPSTTDFFEFSKLEALGTAVLYFLKTVDIVSSNPGVPVGDLAVIKCQQLDTLKSFAPENDCASLLGHIIYYPYTPYREDAPWFPPGSAPFFLRSIYDSNEGYKRTEHLQNAKVIKAVGNRVQSDLAQNVSLAVVNKHFKVIAAICFLKEGIEAACAYFISVGVLKLKAYPTAPSLHEQLTQEETNVDINEIDNHEEQTFERYENVERNIGYKFNNSAILVQTFMHSSVFKSKNNEILEFLGDAVLELAVSKYIHQKFPNASLEEAYNVKSGIICNNVFAWVSVSDPLNLPELLMCSRPNLIDDIQPSNRSKSNGLLSKTATKLSSDVFEALAGAILVDSGYSFETTSKVLLNLLHDVLENMSEYGIQVPKEKQITKE